MKKIIVIVGLLIMLPCLKSNGQDPITEAIKAGITKVIKAIDLKVQRLQNETIWLQNAQKVIENKMSELKLGQISSWVEKQKSLYAEYFEELWKVKNVLAYYHRINDVTKKQIALVAEYKRAFALFKRDKHFSAEEILYMGRVYTGIVGESLKNIDELILVVSSFSTQMADAKRLEIIDKAASQLEVHYNNLKDFNNETILLSLQRAKAGNDIDVIKSLYGIK